MHFRHFYSFHQAHANQKITPRLTLAEKSKNCPGHSPGWKGLKNEDSTMPILRETAYH
jgi:hypothetical protein